MNLDTLRNAISGKGLRITPQRMAVMEALFQADNHPTAEKIMEFIHINHPNIATGTVYKTLETFIDKGIIQRVKTDKDVMRYDAIIAHHHHLYCAVSDRITNYFDEELNRLLEDYFNTKKIPGFEIEDIRLQIIGKFNKTN